MQGDMQLGEVVGGRWQLTAYLGRGAFGQVYRATDTSRVSLGDAAVKVLHPNTSPVERDDFLGEARKVATMRHSNLVAYLDSGEYVHHDGTHRAYLVTELCDASLSDDLAARPDHRLTSAETETLVRDISSGLQHLHHRGILHRDLKPANILRTADGWKLADFGLARDLTATGHYHRGDAVKGTPQYMAPELFGEAGAGRATDVYALGVTIHQALSGRFLYEAQSDLALIAQIAAGQPTIDPGLDPRWATFVADLIQSEPGARPATDRVTSVMEARLSEVGTIGAPGAATVAAAPTTWAEAETNTGARSNPASTTGLIAAGVALGVLVIGAIALVALPDTADDAADDTGPTSAESAEGPVDATQTTTVPLMTPQERLASVLLTEGDGPAGFAFSHVEPPDSESCLGVDNPATIHPGVATDAVDFATDFEVSAHYFLARATVHASVEDAQRYLILAERLRSSCNGQPVDATNDTAVAQYSEATEVTINGADEFTASNIVYPGPATVELLTIYARVGDLVVLSTGSDRSTVRYYAQLMVARATGSEEPTKVEPTGPASGSLNADAAAGVRTSAANPDLDVTPATTAWLDTHSDADVDLLMDRVCAGFRNSTDDDQVAALAAVYGGLDPAVRGDLQPPDFGQLAGLGMVYYCPESIPLEPVGG